MPDGKTPIRTSFLIASLLSLLWLAATLLFLGNGVAAASTLLPAIATAFAPVAAFYALAAALGARPPEPPATRPGPDELAGDELQLATDRLEQLRHSLQLESSGLQAVNETLGLQAQSVTDLAAELGKAAVQAMEAGQMLDALLPKATDATTALRQALEEATTSASHEAEQASASTQALTEALDLLSQQAGAAGASLAEARAASEAGTRAIRSEADTLFETLENTHVARRDALARQGEAMLQQLQTAHTRFEALAAAAIDRLATQLAAIDQQAGGIEGRLQANAALTETLLASGERAFQLLDARLSHSNETSERSLDRLATRVQQVGGTLAQLTQPIRDTAAAATNLDRSVGTLREQALQVVDLLGKAIPEQAHQAGRATAGLAEEVHGLETAIRAAHGAAHSLAEPLQRQRQLLDEAGAICAGQREASETAAAALVAEVQQAKLLLGEVETQIGNAALSSASSLVDTMTRLREVIAQASGSMREALDSTIVEARESLSEAATGAMRKSFAEPITRHAREAEEVAARAAERTAKSMAALADVLRLIEGQVAERTTHLEQAQQADLLAAAGLLTERLAQQSVSIASALGRPMDDDDWAQWRKGERTLFHRRARALLEKQEAKELRALLQADGDFAQAARDYSAGFEALVQRIGARTPALATALQGSEQGRLAAALAEALTA